MQNRIFPFIPTPVDYCIKCDTPHVIEMYNCYGKPIGLSQILNFTTNIADASKTFITMARCRKCGQSYLVCWDSNGVPYTTDTPDRINTFVKAFHDFEAKELTEDEIIKFKTEELLRHRKRSSEG